MTNMKQHGCENLCSNKVQHWPLTSRTIGVIRTLQPEPYICMPKSSLPLVAIHVHLHMDILLFVYFGPFTHGKVYHRINRILYTCTGL